MAHRQFGANNRKAEEASGLHRQAIQPIRV